MLASTPKILDYEDLRAHQNNIKNKPRTITQSFESEVSRKSREGHEYNALAFQEQWMWIQRTFYKVQSGRDLLIKRQFVNGDADDFINAPEIHQTLIRKYGDQLHPLINEWAVYYIGTTAGEKYDPSTTDDLIEIEHTRYRNSYRPSIFKQTDVVIQRPLLWQEYLNRLMPKTETCTTSAGQEISQQDYFESYIAQRLQHPSKPPLIAILLRGEHGTGKGYWMDNILKPLLGENNYISITLGDLQKSFNKDLYYKLLVHIEEINDSRGKAGEKLKKFITEDSARVEAKYSNATLARKYFGIVASSNVPDPVRIEQNDRRYFVPVYSIHQTNNNETKAFFNRLSLWLKKKNGIQEIANYLYSLNIENFDFSSPPTTDAKEQIMEQQTASEDNTTKATIEISEQYKGYVFSVTDVVKQWHITQSCARWALTHAGFVSIKRRWNPGGPAINCWAHKSLQPKDGNWAKVEYQLFTRREDDNPTINRQFGVGIHQNL